MATMTLSDGIKVVRGDGNSHEYTAECGCYATIGSGGGTIVLCDSHNATPLLEIAEEQLASAYTKYEPRWDGDLGYHWNREGCYGEACECGGQRLAEAIARARGEGVLA